MTNYIGNTEITEPLVKDGFEPLTKREYFAGLAMQGLAATGQFSEHRDSGLAPGTYAKGNIHILAVSFADRLITELNKEKTDKGENTND